ncbi:MAG: hypothetical protein Q7V56_14790 [Gammaproteobacteria bacterium]|nr:hypothetical protein [Gammaproteobacteria bacterium]
MKIKFDRTTLLKFVCLIILFVALFMGAAELVLLVDLGGIDFAVTFLLVYFATIRDAISYKYRNLKSGLNELIAYASGLYMFRQRVFVSYLSVSSLIVAMTASLFFACLLWVPLIYVSSGLVT